MTNAITSEIDALQRMTTNELLERYAELHGQPSRTRHRTYLIRKIASRIQANAEGDLSERARKRAAELADDAEIRVMAPKTLVCPPQLDKAPPVTRQIQNDPRLPTPGSAIVREYKGRTIRVVVLGRGEGFEYDGERYRTTSSSYKSHTPWRFEMTTGGERNVCSPQEWYYRYCPEQSIVSKLTSCSAILCVRLRQPVTL